MIDIVNRICPLSFMYGFADDCVLGFDGLTGSSVFREGRNHDLNVRGPRVSTLAGRSCIGFSGCQQIGPIRWGRRCGGKVSSRVDPPGVRSVFSSIALVRPRLRQPYVAWHWGGSNPSKCGGKATGSPWLGTDQLPGIVWRPAVPSRVSDFAGMARGPPFFNLSLLDLGLVRMLFDSAGEDSALWLMSPSVREGGCSGGRRSHHGVCD